MVRNVATPPEHLRPRVRSRARRAGSGARGTRRAVGLLRRSCWRESTSGPGLVESGRDGVVNELDRAAFVERFGPLFEHSPWVAEDAWSDRPFADEDELFEALRIRHVLRTARAPARAHPRPSRPRRQGRDRGLADQQLQARAGGGRARPTDTRRVRSVHAHEHGLPGAVRLPVRRLRPRAHEGVDPAGRQPSGSITPATRRCAWRWRRSRRSRGCGWRTSSEDLLRQAARPGAPDRRRRRARIRGQHRGPRGQLPARLHRGRQLRRSSPPTR